MTYPELHVAEQAARDGAAVALHHFRAGAAVFAKETQAGQATSYNLVSEADLQAEAAIVAVIRAAFPGHAVLSEELHGGFGFAGLAPTRLRSGR